MQGNHANSSLTNQINLMGRSEKYITSQADIRLVLEIATFILGKTNKQTKNTNCFKAFQTDKRLPYT